MTAKEGNQQAAIERLMASQQLAKETKMNYVLRVDKFLAFALLTQ